MDIRSRKIQNGALLAYVLIAVQFVTGLLYTPVILHQLGSQKYGIYSLCVSFTGYLTLLNGAVNAAYVRFYVQEKNKKGYDIPKLNGLFKKIFLVLSIIAFFAGMTVCHFAEYIFGDQMTAGEYQTLRKCLFIITFQASINIINCIYSSLLIANEQFVFIKVINIMNVIANFVIIVPFLYQGFDIEVIMLVQLVTSIAILFINKIYCKKRLGEIFDLKNRDLALLKNVVLFSGIIVLQSIMDQFNWQIDKLILARFCGVVEVAIYSIGSQFLTYYITIASASSSLFITKINLLVSQKKDDELNDLFLSTSRFFAIIVFYVMFGFVFLGKQFIIIWAGEEYANSYYIALLLMLPVTVSLTQGVGQDIVRAKNQHTALILINFSVCVLNIIISIPLAIWYGGLGSALGTFFTEFIICVIIKNIYYSRRISLNIKAYIQEMFHIIVGLVIPFVFCSIIGIFELVNPSLFSITFWGTSFSLCYFISVWAFVLSVDEKRMIQSMFIKKANSL